MRQLSRLSSPGAQRLRHFRPDVATPPALAALPGANSTPACWNSSVASMVVGIFAFGDGFNAIGDKLMRGVNIQFVLGGARQGDINRYRPRLLAFEIDQTKFFGVICPRPSRLALISIRRASFSFVNPLSSTTKCRWSPDAVITRAPNSIAFSIAYWATLPGPETKRASFKTHTVAF